MEGIFTKNVLLALVIVALLVLSAALFIPVRKNEGAKTSEENTIQQTQEEGLSVSNLFNVTETPGPITKDSLPSDIKPDEACRVENYIVKEGTVASNTICVNDTPTPTFTITPSPTPSI